MKPIEYFLFNFIKTLIAFGFFFAFSIAAVKAHFQELIPTNDIVAQENISPSKDPQFSLSLRFTHPMDNGPLMEMVKPARFGVLINGKTHDLLTSLIPNKQGGKTIWSAPYKLREPGDHIFYVSPQPYWEASEKKMIVHHTKVVVDGFHGGDGWDKLVGLPVEIEPLTRPYGLWTNSLFRGRVLRNGTPVAFATVEVEYRNDKGQVQIPFSPYSTQEIKTDAQGVFSFPLLRAGWWGFAALTDAPFKLPNPDGELSTVEEAGLIWVFARDMDLKKRGD